MPIAYAGTICFAFAILHTFSVNYFHSIAKRFHKKSVGEKFFHLLGEVEIVFAIWAGIFVAFYVFTNGFTPAIQYLQGLNFKEPLFVPVIMIICASHPVLKACDWLIRITAGFIPGNRNVGFFFSTLALGPILGSIITEPAAMTITASILLKTVYQNQVSERLRYATLGLLFVNVSIGGTLTPYAAPPVLMVASKWNWGLQFMLINFGWKALIGILCSTFFVTFRFRKEIALLPQDVPFEKDGIRVPLWVILLHLLILFATVLSSHHVILFIGFFLVFLGIARVTKKFQTDLKAKEAFLVGLFLGGLVVLAGYQSWWLEPALSKLTALQLYLGSISLTAFTDNAAITYLGSQVPGLSLKFKYLLVAGSIVGGGLTVIANAPNPAGYGILNSSFGADGINSIKLFVYALIPTLFSALIFWFF